MDFLSDIGLVALGSRTKALSDRLYALADAIYAARGSSVQGRWFPVLRLLHDQGPKTVGEIARHIGQTHSAVSQLADKLIANGWLEVASDGVDQRRRVLQLASPARVAIREVKPVWRAIHEVLAERCAAAQIDLLGALDTFERLVEPDVADAILARCSDIEKAAVRVVPFQPELREYFYRLNADWLRKYFYIEEIDHRVLSNPETEILQPGGAILFALVGDSVAGTCALRQEENGRYELTKMAVEERYRGLGIGRALLVAAIDEFKRREGTQLFLESNAKLAPALALYESLGFQRQASLKSDSHYSRADVYMVWHDPQAADMARPGGRTSQPPSHARASRSPRVKSKA